MNRRAHASGASVGGAVVGGAVVGPWDVGAQDGAAVERKGFLDGEPPAIDGA